MKLCFSLFCYLAFNFTDYRNGSFHTFNFGSRFLANIDDDTIDLVPSVASSCEMCCCVMFLL